MAGNINLTDLVALEAQVGTLGENMNVGDAQKKQEFCEAVKVKEAKLDHDLNDLRATAQKAKNDMKARLAGLDDETKEMPGWKEIAESMEVTEAAEKNGV
ncbi:hypothetical protein CC86DRAFT_371431 [Ophiobolus disseminans]|uniref:Uncharacterized protein n=1 Tax=Ophiobolus disseminans TaxID=1469910 RepID=A0A6A6ZV75_9PLEO|nr:hypothetical protein CC86DRAFT_371431 [Ophiobolus disseminans]